MTSNVKINAKHADVTVLAEKLQSILDECARAGVPVRVYTPRLYDNVAADDVEVKSRRAWDGKAIEYYVQI